jgi:hypothetical protein
VAQKATLPLVVSVNLIEVGEHLLGRAVDLDALLDHGLDPLFVPFLAVTSLSVCA